jgi:hypothetical protein
LANFGDIAGGAMSGASAGAALGPWGAAAGGLIGGVIGAFSGSDDEDKPKFNDPFEGVLTGQALSDQKSHLGADMANHAKTGIEERSREQEREFQNNPDFAGNASVQSAFYNKSRLGAEGSMIDANLKGAELDQATHEKGFQELSGLRSFDYGKYLNDVREQQKPSFFNSLAQEGLSSLTGAFMGQVGTKGGKDWFGLKPSSSAPSIGSAQGDDLGGVSDDMG